ncbi:MAG: glycosyltransferase [Bacteroidetes bacterium]|nr:glycosyltransferase [Bacteroidota bacterium]
MFSKSSHKKHVHLIAFDIPYPSDYGGVIDIYNKLIAFKENDVKVHLHCFEYGRKHSTILNELCETVDYYKRDISKTNLFRRRPYIVVTRSSDDLIHNLMKDNYPILFEGLHCCYYLADRRLKKRRKIVRTHNIEHDYYLNLAKIEKDIFKRYYYMNESQKLKRYESVLKEASGIAVISNNDYIYFSSKYKNVKLVSAFHQNNTIEIKTETGKYALYHGSLHVGENNEAAMYLINNVFNDIEIPLVIAGNKPSPELKQAVEGKKNIKLVSEVDTEGIFELIENAQINILPTFQATGIKLKLLAALYNGKYCIVNSPMVRNTGLESLCVIKDTPELMKTEVVKLFNAPFEMSEIIKREEILLNNGFSNKHNIQRLMRMLFN